MWMLSGNITTVHEDEHVERYSLMNDEICRTANGSRHRRDLAEIEVQEARMLTALHGDEAEQFEGYSSNGG
jgi:hypothetical protein